MKYFSHRVEQGLGGIPRLILLASIPVVIGVFTFFIHSEFGNAQTAEDDDSIATLTPPPSYSGYNWKGTEIFCGYEAITEEEDHDELYQVGIIETYDYSSRGVNWDWEYENYVSYGGYTTVGSGVGSFSENRESDATYERWVVRRPNSEGGDYCTGGETDFVGRYDHFRVGDYAGTGSDTEFVREYAEARENENYNYNYDKYEYDRDSTSDVSVTSDKRKVTSPGDTRSRFRWSYDGWTEKLYYLDGNLEHDGSFDSGGLKSSSEIYTNDWSNCVFDESVKTGKLGVVDDQHIGDGYGSVSWGSLSWSEAFNDYSCDDTYTPTSYTVDGSGDNRRSESDSDSSSNDESSADGTLSWSLSSGLSISLQSPITKESALEDAWARALERKSELQEEQTDPFGGGGSASGNASSAWSNPEPDFSSEGVPEGGTLYLPDLATDPSGSVTGLTAKYEFGESKTEDLTVAVPVRVTYNRSNSRERYTEEDELYFTLSEGETEVIVDIGPKGSAYPITEWDMLVEISGGAYVVSDPITGCTDPEATNYNPNAESDDGSCEYDDPITGCTDPTATNYNPDAEEDDGSCEYDDPIRGCTDPNATNYDPDADYNDGSCEYDDPVGGCTDPSANNYNPDADYNDGSCEYDDPPPEGDGGCTDPDANNYDPNADYNDGSCMYDEPIGGCTDPHADNYDPDADYNDGSCEYDNQPPPESNWGCTDPNATNYDPDAEEDDGSCEYPKLTVVIEGKGAVDVSVDETDCVNEDEGTDSCTYHDVPNSSVTLSSYPASDWILEGWYDNGDTLLSEELDHRIGMDGEDKTIKVVFVGDGSPPQSGSVVVSLRVDPGDGSGSIETGRTNVLEWEILEDSSDEIEDCDIRYNEGRSGITTSWNWNNTDGPGQVIVGDGEDTGGDAVPFSEEGSYSYTLRCNDSGGELLDGDNTDFDVVDSSDDPNDPNDPNEGDPTFDILWEEF